MQRDLDVLTNLQVTELTDQLTENQNLRNLVEKLKIEKKDQFIYLILGIIEVIDTFESAERSIKEKKLNKDEDSQKIIDRFASVNKRLTKLLQKDGVTKIEFPENRLIIGYCKVIDTEPDLKLPNDTILEVIRNGYIHGKELIREAEVIIVRN